MTYPISGLLFILIIEAIIQVPLARYYRQYKRDTESAIMIALTMLVLFFAGMASYFMFLSIFFYMT